MDQTTSPIILKSEDATANLAAKLAPLARPGDAICLEGTLGAGKTLFARHFIRKLTHADEPVPSPTYALLQTYDGSSGPIAHFDLYRLEHEDELEEIGFFDCLDDAICLIEWPDRLGPDTPKDALLVQLEPDIVDENTRRLTLEWTAPKWNNRLKGVFDDV